MNREAELLMQLTARCFIRITNKFPLFFASPEANIWQLEVEHVSWRGFVVKSEGKDLADLLTAARIAIEVFERDIEAKRSALSTLHPDKDKYAIEELLRETVTL